MTVQEQAVTALRKAVEPNAVEAMRNNLKGTLAEFIETSAAMSDDEAAKWIVHCARVYLRFDADNPHIVLTTTIKGATRFETHAEANKVALRVRNGNNERGQAVTVAQAYNEAISNLRSLLGAF